jgi:hypothetical protein
VAIRAEIAKNYTHQGRRALHCILGKQCHHVSVRDYQWVNVHCYTSLRFKHSRYSDTLERRDAWIRPTMMASTRALLSATSFSMYMAKGVPSIGSRKSSPLTSLLLAAASDSLLTWAWRRAEFRGAIGSWGQRIREVLGVPKVSAWVRLNCNPCAVQPGNLASFQASNFSCWIERWYTVH